MHAENFTSFQNQVESDYQKALVAIKEARLNDALTILNTCLKHNPKHRPSLQQRSRIYRKQDEFDKALVDINLALEEDSSNNALLVERGRIFYYLDRYHDALRDFQRSIEINPDYFDVYLYRGEVLYQLKQYQSCLDDLNCLIKFYDKQPSAYYLKSVIYFHWNQFPRELEEIVRFLQLKSKQPLSSSLNFHEAILERITIMLNKEHDPLLHHIQNILLQRLTTDYVAENGPNKYTSRRRSRSIIEIEGERFEEAQERPAQGRQLTRFFKSQNNVKNVQLVVKSSTENQLQAFRNEQSVWTIHYPQNPAQLFIFESAKFDDVRLVLPHLTGETLYDYIQWPLSLDEVFLTWLDLGLELQRLHQSGWAHQDFKPTNVIVSFRPQAPIQTHIIDFGLSAPLGHLFSGCPRFSKAFHVAPELFTLEQPVLLTPQVDVYSLGIAILIHYPYKNQVSKVLLETLRQTVTNAYKDPAKETVLEKVLSQMPHFPKALGYILKLNIDNPSCHSFFKQVLEALISEMGNEFSTPMANILKRATSLTPSERPPLYKILECLMSELVPSHALTLNRLCMWIQHLEPVRFHILLEVMNKFDKTTQQHLFQPELMSVMARRFHEIAVHSFRGPLYQDLNGFVISLIIGFNLIVREHLSSSFARSTLYIQPIIPLNENHLTELVHYQESLNSPLGLLICGMLLDGYIVTRVNEHKPRDYWQKRFQDAIVFYLQAGNANATLKPYTTHLLAKKGFFAKFESPLKRIQDDYANIARLYSKHIYPRNNRAVA